MSTFSTLTGKTVETEFTVMTCQCGAQFALTTAHRSELRKSHGGKMNLPETIPVLNPGQFCKHKLSDAGGRHCLVGWMNTLFDTGGRLPVYRAIEHVAGCDGKPVAHFNDDSRNSCEVLAAVWQTAMEKLGYVRDGTVNRLRAERAKGEA